MKSARGMTTLFICLVLSAGIFAFRPIPHREVATPRIEVAPLAKPTIAALDLAAFRTPIWIAEPPPPAPVAAAPPPPPPPPLKLQLLAIIREDNTHKAAVYDPDTDRLLVVSAGEKLGLRTVEQVDATSLTLRDDTGQRVLALKTEGGTP